MTTTHFREPFIGSLPPLLITHPSKIPCDPAYRPNIYRSQQTSGTGIAVQNVKSDLVTGTRHRLKPAMPRTVLPCFEPCQ